MYSNFISKKTLPCHAIADRLHDSQFSDVSLGMKSLARSATIDLGDDLRLPDDDLRLYRIGPTGFAAQRIHD